MTTLRVTSTSSLSYTGGAGETVTPPSVSVSSPYPVGGYVDAGIPIPDGASGFFSAAFGGVTNATKIEVVNDTRQNVDWGMNGNGCVATMTPGFRMTFESPSHDANANLWMQSLEFVLSDTQDGDGYIQVKVFGYADD